MTHELPDDAMQIRLCMANSGWHSNDRLSDLGWGDKIGYSIWFERWDWHGHKGGEVCFHEHTNNLSDINLVVKIAAQRAIDAWDTYPTCIPHQYLDRVAPHTIQPDWAVVPPEYKGGVS